MGAAAHTIVTIAMRGHCYPSGGFGIQRLPVLPTSTRLDVRYRKYRVGRLYVWEE